MSSYRTSDVTYHSWKCTSELQLVFTITDEFSCIYYKDVVAQSA